jgi:Nickel responsive protein SCO4226-like
VGIFLVERYLPDVAFEQLSLLVERLKAASAQMRAEGTPVEHLDSTFVPEEETCFCRFQAPSTQVTAAVNQLADAPYARISAAVTLN